MGLLTSDEAKHIQDYLAQLRAGHVPSRQDTETLLALAQRLECGTELEAVTAGVSLALVGSFILGLQGTATVSPGIDAASATESVRKFLRSCGATQISPQQCSHVPDEGWVVIVQVSNLRLRFTVDDKTGEIKKYVL